jgi:cytoskeletal protein CcmA (bactofilin family)
VKSPFNTANITSLIAQGTEIRGEIVFQGNLEIEGRVTGNIFAEEGATAELCIREKAQIEGEIHVPSIIINGHVNGDVYSSKHLELAAKAVVNGNVFYNMIEMVIGSEVNGGLQHRPAGVKQPDRLTHDKPEADTNDGPVVAI